MSWYRDMGFCSLAHAVMRHEDYWKAEHPKGDTGCLAYLSVYGRAQLYESQFGPLPIVDVE